MREATPSPVKASARAWTSSLRSCSRKARELGPVGLPLLEKGVLSLLRFVREVVQQRRIAGELLQSGLPVGVDVERRLEEAERGGALLHDLARPLHRLVVQPRDGDD